MPAEHVGRAVFRQAAQSRIITSAHRINQGSIPDLSCANTQRLDSGFATVSTGPYTVARAIADYLEDYRRRSGQATEGSESVVRRNVLPLSLIHISEPTRQAE